MSAEVIPVTAAPLASMTCDRINCGAQGWIEVELPGDSRLAFCAHHYPEVEENLKVHAVRIIDYRPHLFAQEGRA